MLSSSSSKQHLDNSILKEGLKILVITKPNELFYRDEKVGCRLIGAGR